MNNILKIFSKTEKKVTPVIHWEYGKFSLDVLNEFFRAPTQEKFNEFRLSRKMLLAIVHHTERSKYSEFFSWEDWHLVTQWDNSDLFDGQVSPETRDFAFHRLAKEVPGLAEWIFIYRNDPNGYKRAFPLITRLIEQTDFDALLPHLDQNSPNELQGAITKRIQTFSRSNKQWFDAYKTFGHKWNPRFFSYVKEKFWETIIDQEDLERVCMYFHPTRVMEKRNELVKVA